VAGLGAEAPGLAPSMRATCAWGMTAQTLPNASAWMAGVCRPKTSSTGISSEANHGAADSAASPAHSAT
jgi:hypothetical protein